MSKLRFRPPAAAMVVTILSMLTPLATFSQEAQPPPDEKPAVESNLREQTIYIPYTKLRGVFEKEGRGVFLTYDKFQELWREAREKKGTMPDVRPPVGALITDIDNEATVGKDVVRVVAKIKLELLAEGWSEIPLRLADAAILSAKLGDEPARVVHDPAGGYKLLVERKGKEPAQLELALEYAKSISKAPGQNSVSFEAPQAPVSRWKIIIPEADAKVNIHPHLAATQAPAGGLENKPEAKPENVGNALRGVPAPAKETVVLAFVGAAPQVRIEWTPKTEGATGLAALANVQVQQEITLEEGAMRTRARLVYDITRAELSQLIIEVPADQKVVNVFDANVRQWEAEKMGDAQQIKVQLFAPTRGAQNVVVELEKFSEEIGKKDVTAPVIKAVGAGRQQGMVAVRLAGELKGETTRRTGLLQLDSAELPSTFTAGPWDFTYRYATVPFELTLATEKVQPRVRAEELVEAFLEPEQLTLNLLALYHIERAGVFQLEITLPPGFDVRQAVGRGVAPPGAEAYEAVQVDSFHVTGETKNRLLVNLSRKALGRVGLSVELQKRLDDANLLTPTGKSSDLPLLLPRVAATSVERSTGRLVVYAPESLRVNPGKQAGVRAVSLAEALSGVESCRGQRFPLLREALAFAFTQEPTDLVLSAQRRKPFVTARQLLVASVEPGVVKYEARFFYDVLYSGVKSLRIDVPEKLAGDIRVATPGVREKKLDPPPADLPQDYVAWSLTGDKEFLGASAIRLTWERKTADLAVGKSLAIEIPRLAPREVDRAWGQIVAQKAESIDVAPVVEKVKGLRPIDPQHDLMPGANLSDAARAFEFQDEWSLALLATRYKLEEVKRSSIERAVVRMVVTRGDQVSVQALYRMRSARQRLAIKLPVGVDPARSFDAQPLRINGQQKTLERGDQDEFFVPLVGRNPEEPFLLELRYTAAGNHTALELPEFPEEPAVQQVHLCAYLPQELALLGARGPWTGRHADGWHAIWEGPAADYGLANQLINELVSGISLSEHPTSGFSTDGKLYVYSTLRPAVAPEGSLSLVTINKTWLNVLVFGLVAAGGLVMLRRPMSQRAFAISILVIGLVLAGVFLPTFSTQVLDLALVLAISLVLVAWFAWYALTALPRQTATVPLAATSPFSASPSVANQVVPPTPVAPAVDYRPVEPPNPGAGGITFSDSRGSSTKGPSEGGPSNG